MPQTIGGANIIQSPGAQVDWTSAVNMLIQSNAASRDRELKRALDIYANLEAERAKRPVAQQEQFLIDRADDYAQARVMIDEAGKGLLGKLLAGADRKQRFADYMADAQFYETDPSEAAVQHQAQSNDWGGPPSPPAQVAGPALTAKPIAPPAVPGAPQTPAGKPAVAPLPDISGYLEAAKYGMPRALAGQGWRPTGDPAKPYEWIDPQTVDVAQGGENRYFRREDARQRWKNNEFNEADLQVPHAYNADVLRDAWVRKAAAAMQTSLPASASDADRAAVVQSALERYGPKLRKRFDELFGFQTPASDLAGTRLDDGRVVENPKGFIEPAEEGLLWAQRAQAASAQGLDWRSIKYEGESFPGEAALFLELAGSMQWKPSASGGQIDRAIQNQIYAPKDSGPKVAPRGGRSTEGAMLGSPLGALALGRPGVGGPVSDVPSPEARMLGQGDQSYRPSVSPGASPTRPEGLSPVAPLEPKIGSGAAPTWIDLMRQRVGLPKAEGAAELTPFPGPAVQGDSTQEQAPQTFAAKHQQALAQEIQATLPGVTRAIDQLKAGNYLTPREAHEIDRANTLAGRYFAEVTDGEKRTMMSLIREASRDPAQRDELRSILNYRLSAERMSIESLASLDPTAAEARLNEQQNQNERMRILLASQAGEGEAQNAAQELASKLAANLGEVYKQGGVIYEGVYQANMQKHGKPDVAAREAEDAQARYLASAKSVENAGIQAMNFMLGTNFTPSEVQKSSAAQNWLQRFLGAPTREMYNLDFRSGTQGTQGTGSSNSDAAKAAAEEILRRKEQ